MINSIQQIVRTTDAAVASIYLSLFRERSALITFLFHSLFRDEREMSLELIDPLQRTTTRQFRQLIEYYLHHGYRFISPRDLERDLPPDGKYVLLTFDDGYYNNTLALPVLEMYNVPALFFISTESVLRGRCFWWDVLYRERLKRGATRRQAYREGLAMKSMKTEDIELKLAAEFGPDAFNACGDIDRPMRPDELRDFARHRCVHLGNHTADHAILTNYTPAEIHDQLSRAQVSLREMTGIEPRTVAYPNGAYNDDVLRACKEIGLTLGFTTRPRKTHLSSSSREDDRMLIGRFMPQGDGSIEPQCRTYRSDYAIYGRFRDMYVRLAHQGASA